MEETALAIGGTILGVIVGGVGTYIIQSLVTRRGEALAARLELPLIRTMIWDDNPLRIHEQASLIRARISLLGVDPTLGNELEKAALACYEEWYENRDVYHGGETITRESLSRLDAAIIGLDEAILGTTRGFGRKRRARKSLQD